jgi:hypothetical protein
MGAKEVSKACVRVFLPALLIYDLGNQLHKGNTSNYAIIIGWFVSFSRKCNLQWKSMVFDLQWNLAGSGEPYYQDVEASKMGDASHRVQQREEISILSLTRIHSTACYFYSQHRSLSF